MNFRVCFQALLVPVHSVFLAGLVSASPVLEYNRDIRPILSENCFSCHGFDEKARKAGLRLDLAAGAYAARDGAFPLKPGDPGASQVWLRIISEDPEEVMPPPKSHLKLAPAERARIKAWIEQGAPYQQHWAFIPPRRSVLPSAEGLAPIDAFVRRRLSAEGLQPAAEAGREMLIRRVFLDLTGLPPSAAEVVEFTQDSDPRAYEKLVDRLLRSPHFGERLALEWLDAARYADTNGFSIDGGRHMWLWRDWVIQAFNDNKPYNRFLVEQIAGDLLPGRTEGDLIATGFQRNNMVTHEGGTIPEENLTNYNADRVKTLGEAVLGLTLGCAQCHDHKYDPITQKDYFQMFAFFNTLGDRGLDGNAGVNPGPFVEAHTILRTGEEPALRTQIAELRALLARPDERVLRAWEEGETSRLSRRGENFKVHPVKVLKVSTPNRGAGFEVEESGRVRLRQPGAMGAFDIATLLPPVREPITGLRAVFHPVAELPGGGWGGGPEEPRRQRAAAGGTAPAELKKGTFVLTAVAATADAVAGDQINLHKLQRFSRVTASSWETTFPPAACLDPRNESGWSPSLEAEGPVHLTATFDRPFNAGETPYLTVQLNFGHGKSLIPGLIELQVITGTDDGTDLPADIVQALSTPAKERSAAQQARLWEHCSANAPALERHRVMLANLEERLAVLTGAFPTMVMEVAANPRDTYILNRGDYAQPTVKVQAGTLSALPPLPQGAPADRLGLALWLTMPDQPLTARVAVNRFWKMCFGQGLVATTADFGFQGEWPSHPELLDWLAVDFMESGWDVKRLLRQMVLSQTYRQTSAATPALLERDPQNRLLARGPRFRLSAEFIRDEALKAGGLLVPRIGGPSVNPYAPGDLWREVSHYGSSPATAQTFVQDHGEKLYRRSLYTYWKRTAPPPNMAAFDAPNREVCTVGRPVTTTPLQALVTLNDPQFVEASRAFAGRMLATEGDDAKKLRWAFLEATSRLPGEAELKVLHKALERERARYAGNPAAAEAYLSTGESPRVPAWPAAEHAAWAQVAVLLLNLSEVVTRN